MKNKISHSRLEESPEAKVRWFRALSLSERMEMLCAFTDLVLENNPGIVELRKNAEPPSGRIRVLEHASEEAAGRDVDREDVRLLRLENEDER